MTVNRPSEGKKVSYYGIGILFGNSGAKSVRERRFQAKKVTNNSSV